VFSVLQSKWFTVLAVVVIGFFSILIVKLRQPLTAVTKELENINQKISEIEKSRLELKRLEDYIKSPSYLERQARLKLNYKKPGESVVFVYKNQYNQNPASAGQGTNPAAKPSIVLPNWQKWLDYLLNKKK
jgi:cell division protein FtsB